MKEKTSDYFIKRITTIKQQFITDYLNNGCSEENGMRADTKQNVREPVIILSSYLTSSELLFFHIIMPFKVL